MQNLLHNLKFLLPLLMALLIYESSTWTYNWTIPDDSVWLGVNPPKSEQTDFIFRNNLIQSNNTGGYMLQAGIDPLPAAGYNNTLDGQIISGNKFDWVDPNPGYSWSSITHGLFTGHERNAYIRYNYLNQVPMAIIRKSCNLITDTSGGIYYNIINGGGVGVNIKGLSGVRVYNNTIYGDRSVASGETWRPLMFIYTNTDTCASGTGGSPAAGTKVKNNIFYTAHDQKMITLADASCVPGFESDYNIFWKEGDGSVRFDYLGSTLTFEAWQALGYDTHSYVMDPNFIDVSTFVPTARLDYGTNLGTDYSTGLATTADWVVGTSPDLTLQNGTWQVGAVLYEAETPIESSAYYVSAAGNDASNGLTPETAWRTIDKVNASMGSIEPGESILFRRGDTFYGTINITKSGTSGNPITFGAYGTGADPIITGFTTVTGWNVYSGNIYEASLNTAEAQTNMVVVDGSTVGMGRYPDSGWLEYTTTNNSTTIYDSDLPDSPDWTGAEVVINKEYWIIDRCNITDHASGTITFSGGKYSYTAPNRRYFIQNDIRCVTTTNEWYHNTSNQNFYIYGNPSSKDVKVATLNYLLYNNGYDYININDLAFKGSISHAIYFNGSTDNCRIEDCDITFAGGSAIENYGGDYLEANRNVISHSNYGIYLTGTNCNARYNDISYIGLINGSPFMPHATGIYLSNTNTTIEYNRIQHISWSGINTSSVATFTIARNFVNYACLRIDDGGGIYATSSSGTRYITQNIVLNSGIGAEDWLIITRGIYYDAGGSGANITDNVVAGCRGAGLLIHYGDNHVITGNLLFNNQRQAEFLKFGTGVTTGTVFNNNQLIAKEATQLTLRENSYTTAEIQAWGTFDYNFYARPIDDDNHFYYSSGYHTLSDWQTLVSPDDSHSRGSFTTVSSTNEILFYYNETSTNKVVASLTTPMVDVSGNTYPIGNLTLSPYSGVVLLPNPSANVYYLSADGSDNNAGTIDSPWFTLEKAWDYVSPGDIVYMRGGTYYYPKTQWLTGASGTPDNYISILNYPGEVPLIRPAVGWTYDGWYYGILFQSMDYIHVKGLDIGYFAYQQTSVCRGIMAQHVNNSIFENLSCHHNELGMSLIGNSGNNLILNCDFYENYDPYTTIPYNNGDGLTVSEIPSSYTNTIRGCRSWWNADDGYDFWGNEGIVYVENCWAWMNGYQEDHVSHNEAPMIGNDGNGFKLGQVDETTTTTRRYLYNCVGALNRINNFSHNVVDPQVLTCEIYNCFSFGVAEYSGFQFNWGAEASINSILRNNIAYLNTANLDSWITHDHNSWNSGYDVSANDFISLDASELFSSRDTSGNLPRINFGRLATGSDLIHTGIAISGLTEDGNGDAWNDPPSLGAFEYSAESSTSLPYLSTTTITDISTYSATGGGNVIHDGSTSVFAKGICWNTSSNPTVSNSSTNNGTGEGSYVSYLTNLNPSTHYFVRAYAINAVGTAYGNNVEFDTLQVSQESSTYIPTVITNSITDISLYSAISGGNVISDGSSNVFSKGVCWNVSINPTTSNYTTNDGSGTGSYISYLTGLNASTHYFVRAYAINAVGTAYGDNIEFDTLEAAQEQPSDVSVGLKTFLVNPYVQSRYYVSYAGKFYVLPYTEDSSVTPEPEPSTYLYKRTGDGWDESGVWAYDEYCATFETGCIYDVSFGVVTDNPIGHFTILSDIPNWLRLYDTFTEEDLSIGSHVSDVSGRVFKAHPISENNTGTDRDGSVYITNDFGQSVTFYVMQYKQPMAPTLQILVDPSDESGMDMPSYESASIEAGYSNAVIQGLYISVPGWTAGDIDVSWRAERTVPTQENYGYGDIKFEHHDVSFSGVLMFNTAANSGDQFTIYLKTGSLISLQVSPAFKNFLNSGGEVSINVTTESINTWNASESYEWLSLINESSSGDGQFTIIAAQQPDGGLRRNATVYVNSEVPTKTITISQDPSVFLYFVPSSYTFGDAGGQHDVSVITNILNPWNASTAADWLSFAGSPSGTGSATLTLWANSQPAAGATYKETIVGGYSEASTAFLTVDQEFLSFTEVVEMREYTFSWNYNQTSEQTSTITTSFNTTLPYWHISNEADIPAWLVWGVYNDTQLEPSSNYESGFILKVHPYENTGYTSRTFTFDICTGSNLSAKSLSVWQGPAPEPIGGESGSIVIEPSGFTCTVNNVHAYLNSPYISFSVTDFDGWNILYGAYNSCYYIVIDASDIILINENLLEVNAIDADAANYVITDANIGRNAVAGDELRVILYGTPV